MNGARKVTPYLHHYPALTRRVQEAPVSVILMSTPKITRRPRHFRCSAKKTAPAISETRAEYPSQPPPLTTLEPQNAESWPPQMISFSAIEELFKEFRQEKESRDPATRYGKASDEEVVVYPRVLRWTTGVNVNNSSSTSSCLLSESSRENWPSTGGEARERVARARAGGKVMEGSEEKEAKLTSYDVPKAFVRSNSAAIITINPSSPESPLNQQEYWAAPATHSKEEASMHQTVTRSVKDFAEDCSGESDKKVGEIILWNDFGSSASSDIVGLTGVGLSMGRGGMASLSAVLRCVACLWQPTQQHISVSVSTIPSKFRFPCNSYGSAGLPPNHLMVSLQKEDQSRTATSTYAQQALVFQ
ncbi:uncharacterized protein EV420DRAFT_1750860 [Desarmillaria tabescens]|uniref:Uncharacterized protein n=1 Tax=Armillaria tabescens TaxID=1929756 RepID=A0AA39MX16_ARMTA|nr:uncharacterized protein EV420DRAFT_1750860 [Desarmillaria tabescens]KAK0448970.1 hypothetical protein EV420DRAFT_1750860 [Desarmillaria tabescens]